MFLATREATVAYPTYRKYKTFTTQPEAFADSRGYVMLDQFRPADIDDVFTYIPDWLRDRLLARATRHGAKPF